MKKLVLFLALLFGAVSLFAQEPLVKFYMLDGSTRIYNLADVDSIGVMDKKNNYVMRIHYRDTLVAYYPTEIIGSIKFEKDTLNRQVLNVYIFTYPKSYLLKTIDSIIFYIDQWQPLTIGSQVWMLKNLNVDHYRNGDSIPEVRDSAQWVNLKTGAWCSYNNSDSFGNIYGKLYNWYAVNDSRGLAPVGWHVPSDAEWRTLTTYLGFEIVAGGKLKETGITHWRSPNTGATNESGFSALPGGWRSYESGTFYNIGLYGYWWSATDYLADKAWHSYLLYYTARVFRNDLPKEYGYSVRCVKDK